MKRFLLPALLAAAAILPVPGQSLPPPYQIADNNATPPPGTPPPAPSASAKSAPSSAKATSAAASQATIDRLTRSNQDLLDLLKKQHDDLLDLLNKQEDLIKDIQYARHLQERQIAVLEDHLEDTLQTNTALQLKITKLQTEIADAASKPGAPAAPAPATTPGAPGSASTPLAPPPPPSTYLPGPQPPGAPGSMWWHRLLTISGNDSKNSDTFHIAGKQWRVLWHNEDRPGAGYKNTSALFINAFPKGDSIPKKVCSQLGTGGDTTEITGSGDYHLKIEASGGHWEAAVEDFTSDPAGK